MPQSFSADARTVTEADVADILFFALGEAAGPITRATCGRLSAEIVGAVIARMGRHADLVESRDALRAAGDTAESLATALHVVRTQEVADRKQACRWVEHFRPELEAIAGKHGVSLGYVRDFAKRHIRGKVIYARRAVTADVNALIARHPLWGAW